MTVIPENFVRTMGEVYGDEGVAWVAGLPGRKEGSVAPQEADQPALDANAVRPEDAGLVGGVGGLESD